MSTALQLFVPSSSPTQPPPKKRSKATFRKLWERVHKPRLIREGRKPSTIAEYELHLNRWENFWDGLRMKHPQPANIRQKHLETWQAALMAEGRGARSINKHLGTIRALLRVAEQRRIAKHRTAIPQLRCPRAARKLYLSTDQIEQLFAATNAATWPGGRVGGIDAPAIWQAALVLFITYGFRTQELLAYERGKRSLTWWNVSFKAETPNPDGQAQNALGWLWYVPQKQERAKPEPLFLPLTAPARAAIDLLAASAGIGPQETDPAKLSRPVFPIPSNGKAFNRQWRAIVSASGIAPKVLPGATPERYRLKHLRKTCATLLDSQFAGLADAVCGWASDRSAVSVTHYISNEARLVQQISAVVFPACFSKIGEPKK